MNRFLYGSLAALRVASPTAPATASMGAVSFLHRFGSSLNPHFSELCFASLEGLAVCRLGALRLSALEFLDRLALFLVLTSKHHLYDV